GYGIVSFAQMPLAGEISFVTTGLEHGCEGPFGFGQAAALALKCHSSHTAAVWYASGLHCRAAGRATWLGIERKEGHAFHRHAIDVRCRHAATYAATVRPKIAVAGVVRHNEKNVGFAGLRLRGQSPTSGEPHPCAERNQRS